MLLQGTNSCNANQVNMAHAKVRVTSAMNPPLLLVDYSRELRLSGKALVRVEAPSSVKSCTPIDAVVLLNVSHSMSWSVASPTQAPSRLDLLKKAIKFIIRQLDDDDCLAIIAFNDQVIKEYSTGLLEISTSSRMAIEKKLDGIMAKGTTAFKPGLDHSVKLLDERVDKSRVGFILLISDGSDNNKFQWADESINSTDPVRILLRKYPIHTLGLCKAHDTKALHFIAKESYGTYSSITDNLETKIMEAFAVCLAGFRTVVATDTCVNITSGSLNITRINSGGYTLRGNSGGIFIGALSAGEVKDFLVSFDYTTGFWARGYSKVLNGITATVTYKNVSGGQSISTETCSVSLPIHTTDTGRAPENPCPPFPAVLQQMVQFQVLDMLKSIVEELFVLKEEAGSAFQREEDDDPVFQAMAANLLQRKWKEFKLSDQTWKEAPKAFLDLGGIDKDINAMVGVLKQGSGVGCIYSWLSSYLMQRPTITGLPAHKEATRFRTPAMEAMVQEANKQMALEAPAQKQDQTICNGASELLDMISERFELWSKVDSNVPPPFQPSSEIEDHVSHNLATVLREDISRARKKDIYMGRRCIATKTKTNSHAGSKPTTTSRRKAGGIVLIKMAPEKVRVSIAMNPPILLVDDRHKLRLNGTAVVRVEAPLSMKSSAPIDLVALLNVNKSMNGAVAPPETLSRLDMVKKAMKFIIRQLDDDDRLAIVAFNDQVIKEYTTGILEISGGTRMAMEQKMDGLMAKGDTAFKPSLEHAVKLLDDRADKKRLGFIILISDGQDNGQYKWNDESVAPTDPIRNLLKKYPVHTFGLCKAHDPKALQFIAKESYGTYSSITDNLDRRIMEAFAVCLAGLKTVIAIDTCINITSSSLNITRIDSGSYQPHGASRGILIGTLYAGEVKDFVVYFYYSTGEWMPGYYTILSGITANVTYKDARRQTSSTDNCSVSLPIHTAESGSAPANPCSHFPVVLQQIIRFKVLDLLTSTLKEFLVLKEEASGAIHGEEGDDMVVQVMAANLLQRKWREFKQTDESWKEAPRAFLDIGGIEKDVNAMVSNLKRGLGVACIYSWLSSCQMQRATVTCLPAHSDAIATGFRTPAMEAMVQEADKQLALEAPTQGQEMEVCKRATELLAMINRRFELWSKLDGDVPTAFQSSSEQEDNEFSNLSAVLRGDISRAKQHDIYLAAENAIMHWRSSFNPAEKMHGDGTTMK
ncbi:hypothetical protein EJB05_01445 [Eragrostis curvula]|uniref:VWFA domain-containing protein n=1 Tax=Eragrostis curvula TaxID=38414 RepID=A0A5J9WPJ3_9POAL|nr:hypothetical protein EJB05_01445 [Eragrostis curvula]